MITEYSKYEPIFGSYYIKKELGEGSFGKVYEIERDDFGGKYQAALKAITIPKKRDEIEQLQVQRRNPTEYYKGVVGRIITEIELMTRLKGNSNIVSYENHQVIPHEDGVGWDILIQMELLTPLYKYLYERDITVKDVVQLGIDMCHALELCHANNIIHRDVKPENIFVSNQGRYKLGDFGVAKVSEATGSGTKAGTESYMAPEIYNNEKYGASADVYSLGLVMYMLLNEYRLPFEEENADNPYVSRVFANSKRMSGAELPDTMYGDVELEKIIKKACAFNTADRYHTARELRRDLEGLGIDGVQEKVGVLDDAAQYNSVISTATVREESPASDATVAENNVGGTVAEYKNIDATIAEYNNAPAPVVTEAKPAEAYHNKVIGKAPVEAVAGPVNEGTVFERSDMLTPAPVQKPEKAKPVKEKKKPAAKGPDEGVKNKKPLIIAGVLVAIIAVIAVVIFTRPKPVDNIAITASITSPYGADARTIDDVNDTLELKYKDEVAFTFEISPEDAKYEPSDVEIEIEGDNIKLDDNGRLVAVKKGDESAITVRAGEYEETYDIKVSAYVKEISDVSDISLYVGDTYQLTPTIKPDNFKGDIKYSTSDKGVATVDKNGVITVVGSGTAKISIKAGGKVKKITVSGSDRPVQTAAPKSSGGSSKPKPAKKKSSGGWDIAD